MSEVSEVVSRAPGAHQRAPHQANEESKMWTGSPIRAKPDRKFFLKRGGVSLRQENGAFKSTCELEFGAKSDITFKLTTHHLFVGKERRKRLLLSSALLDHI